MGNRRSSSPGRPAAADPAPDPAVAAKALTALQDAICVEYTVDRNQGKAYERARGKRVAKRTVAEMFARPQVRARIAELDAEQLGDAKRRREIRIGALMATALDATEKTSDRLRAIELSGKIDGDFVEKHEHTILNEGRADRIKRARERLLRDTPPLPAQPVLAS